METFKEYQDFTDTLLNGGGGYIGEYVGRVSSLLQQCIGVIDEKLAQEGTPDDHQAQFLALRNQFSSLVDQGEIVMKLVHIINYSVGLTTEAAEALEMVKKLAFHKKEIDLENLAKEIGDNLFYSSALSSTLDCDLQEVAQMNVDKLKARYPNGFVPGGGNREGEGK